MEKGPDRHCVCRDPFFLQEDSMKNDQKTKNPEPKLQKDVIALRKACPVRGTGLSHYILMDKAPQPKG